jgi:hypothetical protein
MERGHNDYFETVSAGSTRRRFTLRVRPKFIAVGRLCHGAGAGTARPLSSEYCRLRLLAGHYAIAISYQFTEFVLRAPFRVNGESSESVEQNQRDQTYRDNANEQFGPRAVEQSA